MNSWAVILLAIFGLTKLAATCNDAVCGSIVSKCTLLQSCNCTIEEGSGECSCCQRCHSCLEPLYTECCSCFEGFCPQRNVTLSTLDSTVFDLEDRLPELWDALLEGEDERWNKVVFPVELHPSLVVNQKLLQAGDKAKEGDAEQGRGLLQNADDDFHQCAVMDKMLDEGALGFAANHSSFNHIFANLLKKQDSI